MNTDEHRLNGEGMGLDCSSSTPFSSVFIRAPSVANTISSSVFSVSSVAPYALTVTPLASILDRFTFPLRLDYLSVAQAAAIYVSLGLLILWTGWSWIDPAVSLGIVVVIAFGTWGLLRDSVNMALQAAPPGIDPDDIAEHLRAVPGVAAIHDLHIWPMSTTETALTVHLFVPEGYPGDAFLADVAHQMKERFGIGHATIQVETDPATECALEPPHVV